MAEHGMAEVVEMIYALESDDGFARLSDKCNSLNLFEILGTTKAEIRHSNFLAWLLDPNGNHGLKDRFLRAFAAKLGQADAVPEDTAGCIVRREWQHIDLLVICDAAKYLLCIENKICAQEHGKQLLNYREVLEKEYPDYHRSFAFLTPDGIMPKDESDQQYWQSTSYTDVLDAIRIASEGIALTPEIETLLRHYTEAVKKHVIVDKETEL